MTDLDRAIRESLGNLVECAGPGPALDNITIDSPGPGSRMPLRSRTPWLVAAVVVIVLAVAGGAVWFGSPDDGNQDVISDEGTGTSSTTSTSTATTAESSAAETTVERPATSAPDPAGTVPDGRPQSWLGVTETGALVDVDTASSDTTVVDEVVGGGESSETTTLDRAHRQPGTAVIWATAVGDPAGGTLLRIDQAPVADSWFSFGFAATPSPDGQLVAVASFEGLGLADTANSNELTTVSDTQAFGNNSIAWLRTRQGVVWTYPDPDGTPGFILEVIHLTDGIEVTESRQTKLPPDLAGIVTIAVRGDDAIVVSGCTTEVIEGCDESRTIVLNLATLDIAAELDLAPGALLGGYDPSGQYLIYADSDQVARWHSDSGADILGEGYRWASW